jgi:hypothetical protein
VGSDAEPSSSMVMRRRPVDALVEREPASASLGLVAHCRLTGGELPPSYATNFVPYSAIALAAPPATRREPRPTSDSAARRSCGATAIPPRSRGARASRWHCRLSTSTPMPSNSSRTSSRSRGCSSPTEPSGSRSGRVGSSCAVTPRSPVCERPCGLSPTARLVSCTPGPRANESPDRSGAVHYDQDSRDAPRGGVPQARHRARDRAARGARWRGC